MEQDKDMAKEHVLMEMAQSILVHGSIILNMVKESSSLKMVSGLKALL